MSTRRREGAGPSTGPSRRRRRGITALAIATSIVVSACGGGSDGRAALAVSDTSSPESPESPESADAPMLVAPSTSAAPVTTVQPSTTVADTIAPTTVITLPVPDPPPAPRADEPYVELGRIEIPRIGIDTTLLQGITLTTLDQGPGHWPGTALPGQIGNVVIAGHRTSHNKVFRDVDQLAVGDEVVFTTGEGRFTYTVRETTIVAPDAMYIIDQTFDSTATLFACHPPGSTRQRIVVHLDLATSEPVEA